MVNAGMLTIKENLGDDYYTLRIPNQEVWSAFRELTAFSLQIDEEDMQKLFHRGFTTGHIFHQKRQCINESNSS